MDKKEENMLLTIIVIIVFVFWVVIGFILGQDNIQSKNRIEPELKITVKNGVSDTTFIYKLK